MFFILRNSFIAGKEREGEYVNKKNLSHTVEMEESVAIAAGTMTQADALLEKTFLPHYVGCGLSCLEILCIFEHLMIV
jgi:hypothetical protein